MPLTIHPVRKNVLRQLHCRFSLSAAVFNVSSYPSLLFIIHGFLTFRFTRPLEKLVESMKKVETGWLHRVSVDCSITEIQNLKDSYNQMLVQVNHLIEQLVEQEKAAQQAKLEVILEQMNPHFLYNTLETIGYMAFESPRERNLRCCGMPWGILPFFPKQRKRQSSFEKRAGNHSGLPEDPEIPLW